MDRQTLCRYTYDPLDRLAISAQSGQPISQCFYQAGQLQGEVQGLAHRLLMRHGDRLLAQRDQREGEIDQQLLGSDRQHSVLMANGRQSQQAMAYSPYGHRPVGSALTQLPGFAGERLDPVTGHYMLGNGYRSFNPVLMRFNSPDSLSPFGQGGFNAYAYCLGDPVNYRDPDGHMPGWFGPVFGIALSIVGIVASVATVGAAAPVGSIGFVAAWGALTGAAKVSVSLGFASGVAGVSSGAASWAEPDSSAGSILGYVSMGLGVVSAVAGVGAYGMTKNIKGVLPRNSSAELASFHLPQPIHEVPGRGHFGGAGRTARPASASYEAPSEPTFVEIDTGLFLPSGKKTYFYPNSRFSKPLAAQRENDLGRVTKIEDITDKIRNTSTQAGAGKNLFRRRL